MYMQQATTTSALNRENIKLREKLEKKREKMHFTETQLQLTIKQADQFRHENDRLVTLLKQTKGFDPLQKPSRPDLNQSMNVRKSIRGGGL